MVCAKCPKCGVWSFSACEKGEWVCPRCGVDMTDVEKEPADPRRNYGEMELVEEPNH